MEPLSEHVLSIMAKELHNDRGFGYVVPISVEEAVDAGAVQINADIEDPSEPSKLAARLTDLGKELLRVYLERENEPVPVTTTVGWGGYDIDENVPMPVVTRQRFSKYPFDGLCVGASFHVPPSEKTPDPKKTLTSTVANRNATEKKAVDDGTKPKHFKCVSVGAEDPRGVGVRVFRDA